MKTGTCPICEQPLTSPSCGPTHRDEAMRLREQLDRMVAAFDAPAPFDLADPAKDEEEVTTSFTDFAGRLLLVYPIQQLYDVVTEHGIRNPMRVTVVVLDGPDAPKEIEDVLIWQAVPIRQLTPKLSTGRPLLGVLIQREPKPGKRSGVWVLESREVTDAQQAVAKAYVGSKAAR